jgi:hypothetical protein
VQHKEHSRAWLKSSGARQHTDSTKSVLWPGTVQFGVIVFGLPVRSSGIRLLNCAGEEHLQQLVDPMQVERDVTQSRSVVELRQHAIERCIHLANSEVELHCQCCAQSGH